MQILAKVTAELRLTESQKLEVGKIISRLNKNGGFITASMFGDVLRVSASKEEIKPNQDKYFLWFVIKGKIAEFLRTQVY